MISLEQDEGVIEGEEQLMNYITDFYKNLFGQTEDSNISLNVQDIPQISKNDAEKLIEPFL